MSTSALPRAAAVGAAACLAAAACSSGTSSHATPVAPKPLSLSVSADGNIAGLPASLAAGAYDLTATGQAEYEVQLVRLSSGYGIAQLTADLSALSGKGKPELAAIARVYARTSFVGGPGGTGRQDAVVALTPGDYAFTNIEGQGKVPLRPLTVTAGSVPHLTGTATTITGTGDTKGAYTFTVSGSLAGTGSVTVRDTSATNPHLLDVAKIKTGHTVAQCLDFQGDAATDPASPCTPVLSTAIISPGVTEKVGYHGLGAGTYVLLSYLPDPKTGDVQADEGMSTTVRAS